MGKRVNISTTTVINTELIPLTDHFELLPNGQTEQWYYENTNVFAPDRQIIPLIITPKVTAIDMDTEISYAPSISTSAWYVTAFNGTTWAETLVTNLVDTPSHDYVLVGNNLKVNKNNDDATHSIQIRCVVQYIDPRDSGITYAVEETLTLTTNKDATVLYPKIDILAPSSQAYNPLTDASSQFTFKAKADWSEVPVASESVTKYKAVVGGTEEMVQPTGSLSPILDIRYGEGTGSVLLQNQTFTSRQTGGGQVTSIPNNKAFVEKVQGNSSLIDNVLLCVKCTAIKSSGGSGASAWESVGKLDVTKIKGVYSGGSSLSFMFPDGMRKVGDTADTIAYDNNGVLKATVNIGSRAYASGDESDSSVITDGTNTFYVLSTPVVYTDLQYADGRPITDQSIFEWYGVKNNTEVKMDTLDCYVSGQHTDELTIDAMYGEEIPVILRIKASDADDDVLPPKEQRTVTWKIPHIDSIVTSENGSAVRSNSGAFDFTTIVNTNGQALDEDAINAHLRFNWKRQRNSDNPKVTDLGWGRRITLQPADLINVRGNGNVLDSTAISNDVYLLGAYERVTDNGEDVTYNGEVVFNREV